MTIEKLEKKAEEYVKRNVCENCNKCQSYGYIGCDIYKYSKNSYIAGAKENGVIWHDLRKNPNDLPEASIFNEVLNENGIKVFYDDINKVWNMFFNNYIVRANTPKLWCEIPKFKVEE